MLNILEIKSDPILDKLDIIPDLNLQLQVATQQVFDIKKDSDNIEKNLLDNKSQKSLDNKSQKSLLYKQKYLKAKQQYYLINK